MLILSYFLALSDLSPVTLICEQMFSKFTVLPYSKETKLGNSNQEASSSARNYVKVVSVLFVHGSLPLQLFPVL